MRFFLHLARMCLLDALGITYKIESRCEKMFITFETSIASGYGRFKHRNADRRQLKSAD